MPSERGSSPEPRIGPDEVRRVAALAGLELSEDGVREIAEQLSEIVAHMRSLDRTPPLVDGPAGEPARGAARPRPDHPAFDPLREPPASFAPAWQDPFFTVPPLPGLDGGEAE